MYDRTTVLCGSETPRTAGWAVPFWCRESIKHYILLDKVGKTRSWRCLIAIPQRARSKIPRKRKESPQQLEST